MLVELLTQRLMSQPRRIDDLSALVQGTLLALLMPATVPWWVILVGVACWYLSAKALAEQFRTNESKISSAFASNNSFSRSSEDL